MSSISHSRRGLLASVGRRLGASFAALLLIFTVVLAITVWKVEVVRALSEQSRTEVRKLELADKWLADVRQNSARSLAVAMSTGGDMLNFFRDAMAATSRGTTETQKTFLALAADKPEILALATRVGEVRTEWLAARDEINAVKATGDDARARELVASKFVPVTDKYLQVTQALVEGQMASLDRLQDQVQAEFRDLYLWLGVLFLLAVSIGAVLAWRITRSVTQPIAEAVSITRDVAQGNLSRDVSTDRTDELGDLIRALGDMKGSLVKTMV
ncbi:HAMP domain-containing protein, partial [Hydrogenophaga sp. XSHU_21]